MPENPRVGRQEGALAVERTDLAVERTVLAYPRTALAGMGRGLTAAWEVVWQE